VVSVVSESVHVVVGPVAVIAPLNSLQFPPGPPVLRTCTWYIAPGRLFQDKTTPVPASEACRMGNGITVILEKIPWLGLKYEPLGVVCSFIERTMYV
jgi:hypothetical protein